MKKFSKKILTLFLIISIIFNPSSSVFASNMKNNNTILVVNDGIYIKGSYYSQEEFGKLLDTAIPITQKRQSRSAIAIGGVGSYFVSAGIAGSYFIPGIGEVLITVTGVIIIGGVIIKSGSWVYNKVVNWFEDRSYENAKEKGIPTNNHSTQVGGSLPPKGPPRSSKDKKDKNGKLKQRRYYDKNGNADMDIDYSHGGSDKWHDFPHRHYWNNGHRE